MSLEGYDAWKCDEEWSYWDDEPRPVCLRCQGTYSTPTAPYCGPCARTIDEQIEAGFNPHQAPFARNNKGRRFTMGRYAKDPGGGDFETPEPGSYPARCYRVIDIGTRHNEMYNTDRNEVMIQWELIGTEMSDGRPFSITKFYRNSLHENANLRQHLEAWRGRAFSEQELQGFDLGNLLNAPCFLSIILNERGKTQVNSVMATPKGQTVAPLQNETLAFFLDDPDWDAFKKLSEKMQKMISATPEYQRAIAGGGEESPPPLTDDQECPF